MCHIISLVYGLNVCVDMLKILTPNVMILGGRIFWWGLGLDEVMRDKTFKQLEPF